MSLKSSKTSTGTLTPGAWMLSQNIESSGSQTFSFFPVCQHIHSFYVKTSLNIISNTDAPAKLLFLSPRKQNYKSSLTLCAPPPLPTGVVLVENEKKQKLVNWFTTCEKLSLDWGKSCIRPILILSIVSSGVTYLHCLGRWSCFGASSRGQDWRRTCVLMMAHLHQRRWPSGSAVGDKHIH